MDKTLEKNKLILGHILFWVGYMGLVLAFSSNFDSWERLLPKAMIGLLLQLILVYSNIQLLLPHLLKKKRYLLYVGAVAGLILLLLLFRHQLYEWFVEPPTRGRRWRGKWGWLVNPSMFGLIQFWAISTAYVFLQDWFTAQKQQTELQSEQMKTELKFLRNQISPHFLFNTLNNLYSLIHIQDERAGPVVLKLSELLRYMMKEPSEAYVKLEKEVAFLQNYIELQQLKTDKPREVNFVVEGVKPQHKLAPLLLLNFLENTFKHGDWEKNPHGWIRAKLSVDEENHFSFDLKNSFKADANPTIQEGIGLKNVRRRLEILYPGTHVLKVEVADKEFSVSLKLKL